MQQKITLTREQCREIKKKDREELTKFIRNVYLEGWKDGTHNKVAVSPEAINKIIKDTKGVGEAKRRAIMEKVTKLFEMEDKEV